MSLCNKYKPAINSLVATAAAYDQISYQFKVSKETNSSSIQGTKNVNSLLQNHVSTSQELSLLFTPESPSPPAARERDHRSSVMMGLHTDLGGSTSTPVTVLFPVVFADGRTVGQQTLSKQLQVSPRSCRIGGRGLAP